MLSFGEGTCIYSLSSLAIGFSGSSTYISVVFSIITPCLCSYSCFYFSSFSLFLSSQPSFGCCSSCCHLSFATYKLWFSFFLCSVVCVLCFLFLLLPNMPTWRLNSLSLYNYVLPLLCHQFPLSMILYWIVAFCHYCWSCCHVSVDSFSVNSWASSYIGK